MKGQLAFAGSTVVLSGGADHARARKEFATVADLAAVVTPSVVNVRDRSVARAAATDDRPPAQAVLITDQAGLLFNRKGKSSALLLLSGPNGDRWPDMSITE